MSGASSLAAYQALADEVDLGELWASLHTGDTALYLPRITAGESAMEFAHWLPGEALIDNDFGIGEPAGDAIPVEELSVVVLPCVAVDSGGTRVGFGQGYYDRALEEIAGRDPDRRPLLVGVAFEQQVYAAIEGNEWDVPLDVLITESGVTRTR